MRITFPISMIILGVVIAQAGYELLSRRIDILISILS